MLPGVRLKLTVAVSSLTGAAAADEENKMDKMIMRPGNKIRFMAFTR